MAFDTHAADPHWGSLIIAYFFLGGIAAGAYAMAALASLFGDETDRRLTKPAHYLAFPLVSICGVLLIVDLSYPERFWHMLIASETYRPIVKWWSPMSVGSWGLSLFGFFSFCSFVGALADADFRPLRWAKPWADRMRHGVVGRAIEVAGAASAFFLGAYTGTLLSATNQPVWASTDWISALFLASSASTGIAAILLFHRFFSKLDDEAGLQRLEWLDRWAIVLEALMLVCFVGSIARIDWRAFTIWPGALLPGFVVPCGMILPVLLARGHHRKTSWIGPFLVLAAGLALRYAIVAMPPKFLVTHS